MTPRLPSHLFATGGHLYDCRDPNWAEAEPLRRNYDTSHRDINSVEELKATLRAGPWMWPGGYPKFFLMNGGETVSFDGVRKNLREHIDAIALGHRDRIVGCDVNWEDTDMTCAYTGEVIPSAYGE